MKTVVAAFIAGTFAAGAALAQDLPKTQIKIAGGLSNLTAYNDYEKPFWTKTIPERSRARSRRRSRASTRWASKAPSCCACWARA